MPGSEAGDGLLVIWHSLSGTTDTLVRALCEGARAQVPGLTVRRVHASRATATDVLSCDALVLATPETLASISGQMKDFLDRAYYPLLGRCSGLPVCLLVVGGSDGAPTLAQLRRVVAGQGWREVVPALHHVSGVTPDPGSRAPVMPGPVVPADAVMAARERGATLAAGLALGIY